MRGQARTPLQPPPHISSDLGVISFISEHKKSWALELAPILGDQKRRCIDRAARQLCADKHGRKARGRALWSRGHVGESRGRGSRGRVSGAGGYP